MTESRTKQQTRKAIQDAFIQLLDKKSVEHITAVAVAQKAGINRSTFYVYYEDVYSLLSDIEESILRIIRGHSEELLQDVMLGNAETISRLAMELLDTQVERLVVLLGPHGDHAFSLKLIELAKPLFLKAFGETEPAPELDILLTFEMAGVVGVYTQWCANGRTQPLEVVVHVLQRILQAGLQDVRAAAHALQ